MPVMKAITISDEWLRIDALDLEARGVARRQDGKVVFAEGALPGEEVRVRVTRSKAKWESGEAVQWRRTAFTRVVPRCAHFGVCGGCSMQHIDPQAQLAFKQRTLEDDLWHLAQVRPQSLLRPLAGPAWGYRHRARLTVRFVPKKGGVLVGFHERGSSYVADMRSCDVLPPHVSALLLPLRALIGGLSCPDRLPQIEVAVGDAQTVLVLRHLQPLTLGDRELLSHFEREHGIQWWLQPGGPQTAAPLNPQTTPLDYAMPEFGLRMPFTPTDFTQVNHSINLALVSRAVRLLAPLKHEHVADWFCGLGNFTLPLATRSEHVLGVEGNEGLVQRARDNAEQNGLARCTRFEARNLFEIDADTLKRMGQFEKWLVDPPREGALALCKALCEAAASGYPEPTRIVYVSCNPATLARDAGLLVHQAAYRLTAVGAVNMFPHTSHVESIAIFEKA